MPCLNCESEWDPLFQKTIASGFQPSENLHEPPKPTTVPVVQIWGSDKNNEKTNIFQSSPSCSASVAVDHLTISLNSWWDRRRASGPGWKQLSKKLAQEQAWKTRMAKFHYFLRYFFLKHLVIVQVLSGTNMQQYINMLHHIPQPFLGSNHELCRECSATKEHQSPMIQ